MEVHVVSCSKTTHPLILTSTLYRNGLRQISNGDFFQKCEYGQTAS